MFDETKYNPEIHHRRSIRLKGYDYSQAGAYYITACVKDKMCMFGRVVDEVMMLNDAGIMIDKWWQKIPGKFQDIELGEYQIMPNHFHGIFVNVGADPCVRPVSREADSINEPHIVSNDAIDTSASLGEHIGSPLQRIMQWFKTMSTNEYIRNVKTKDWPPFNRKLFQRDYYEHIIRNEEAYNNIAEYIGNNPKNWNNDKFYLG